MLHRISRDTRLVLKPRRDPDSGPDRFTLTIFIYYYFRFLMTSVSIHSLQKALRNLINCIFEPLANKLRTCFKPTNRTKWSARHFSPERKELVIKLASLIRLIMKSIRSFHQYSRSLRQAHSVHCPGAKRHVIYVQLPAERQMYFQSTYEGEFHGVSQLQQHTRLNAM